MIQSKCRDSDTHFCTNLGMNLLFMFHGSTVPRFHGAYSAFFSIIRDAFVWIRFKIDLLQKIIHRNWHFATGFRLVCEVHGLSLLSSFILSSIDFHFTVDILGTVAEVDIRDIRRIYQLVCCFKYVWIYVKISPFLNTSRAKLKEVYMMVNIQTHS